jgi:hypothetical protein
MASSVRPGGGTVYVASGSFTRPADTTQYAIADLVANNTTAGSVTPISLVFVHDGAGIKITRVRLLKSATSVTSASFRVHFYVTSPTCTNGDNSAWLTTVSGYLGYADLTMSQTFSDDAIGFGVAAFGDAIRCQPGNGSRTIYALLEARGTYTPADSEVFTLYAEAEID